MKCDGRGGWDELPGSILAVCGKSMINNQLWGIAHDLIRLRENWLVEDSFKSSTHPQLFLQVSWYSAYLACKKFFVLSPVPHNTSTLI